MWPPASEWLTKSKIALSIHFPLLLLYCAKNKKSLTQQLPILPLQVQDCPLARQLPCPPCPIPEVYACPE